VQPGPLHHHLERSVARKAFALDHVLVGEHERGISVRRNHHAAGGALHLPADQDFHPDAVAEGFLYDPALLALPESGEREEREEREQGGGAKGQVASLRVASPSTVQAGAPIPKSATVLRRCDNSSGTLSGWGADPAPLP